MKLNKSFLPGDYIGELSLAFDSTHSDTLISWADTHLVTIEKKHFEKVFDVLIRQNREKLDFVSGLLPDLPKNEITTLAYGFEEVHYHSSAFIFQEGQEVDGLYIVKEGEVELFKTLAMKNETSNILPLLKTNQKSQRFSVLISARGQFLGEEILLGTEERKFTAVAKSYKTILYFIPKKHLVKMSLYNLQVIYYLKSLAASLTQAKQLILETATKQNRFQKNFVNHVVERVTEQEKDCLGEAIREMAEKVIEAQKQAENPSDFIRLKRPRANLTLLKGNEDAVSRLIEFKKKTSLFKAKIDPELFQRERAKTRETIPQEETIQSIAKFIKNVPTGVITSDRKKYVYPLSLWENARKKHLSKHNKNVLRRHINEISLPEQTIKNLKTQEDERPSIKNDYLFTQEDIQTYHKLYSKSPISIRYHNKQDPREEKSVDTSLKEKESIETLSFETHTTRNERSESVNPPLLPSLERLVATKLPNAITPICIQGLLPGQKIDNGVPSVQQINTIDKQKNPRANNFGRKNNRERVASVIQNPIAPLNEGFIFMNKKKYDCVNLEINIPTGPYMLPGIRPQKPLSTKVPFVLPKPGEKKVLGLVPNVYC